MIKFNNWYEFRDAVEASIEKGKDTYIFAMLDTNPNVDDFKLDVCNNSNEFYVNDSFSMEEFQKYLFIKYNVVNKSEDYHIVLDWVYDEDECEGEQICYKRLFIFKDEMMEK